MEGTVSDVMARQNNQGDRSAIAEACDWLEDWLTNSRGPGRVRDNQAGGETAAGHSVDTLKRARRGSA